MQFSDSLPTITKAVVNYDQLGELTAEIRRQ